MLDTSKSLSSEFFINPRYPPGVVPTEAASIDVRPSGVANTPERDASTAVLETDHSKVGEHLSSAEVGPGKDLTFPV